MKKASAVSSLALDARHANLPQTITIAVGLSVVLGMLLTDFALGLLCGSLKRWSVGARLISLPSLVAVVAMMQLINMEGDAARLITTLVQSVAAISALFWSFGTLSRQRKRLPQNAQANDQHRDLTSAGRQ